MKNLLEKMDKKFYIIVGSFVALIFIIIIGGALLYNKLFYNLTQSNISNNFKSSIA